jgi:predicted Zn-dependent protease
LLLNADVDRARQTAAELYEKDPLNPAYLSTYAFSLYVKGDMKGALQIMSRLHQDQFKDPSIAAYYGIMLASAGEKTKALEYLEIGKKAQLLPEEKVLMERAEAASR